MSMAPIALFDKSFLQSLKVDEAVWFDHFFMANICPIFYVETLSDLAKKPRPGSTAEREVAIIASKTPQAQGYANAFHLTLAVHNLLGYEVPMNGRIPIAEGRHVQVEGKSGVVYEPSPEQKALERWHHGQFLDVERMFAAGWRRQIRLLDFKDAAKKLNEIGITPQTCKTLEQAHAAAAAALDVASPEHQLLFGLAVLRVPEGPSKAILSRWRAEGSPPLVYFAPYAAFVTTTETFYYIAIAARLISLDPKKNKIDLAYLAYLPFCMCFISSDKFHRNCAELFMRDDQVFVWGQDLKADLKAIDAHFDLLPEEEKEKGLYAIAPAPPEISTTTKQLWDRLMPGWNDGPEAPPISEETERKIVAHVNKFADAPTRLPSAAELSAEPDSMVFKRQVSLKRGKWWQMPKAVGEKQGRA